MNLATAHIPDWNMVEPFNDDPIPDVEEMISDFMTTGACSFGHEDNPIVVMTFEEVMEDVLNEMTEENMMPIFQSMFEFKSFSASKLGRSMIEREATKLLNKKFVKAGIR